MTTPFNEDIIPDNDQTRARREHLDKIRELVGNAYPNKFSRKNIAGGPEGEDTITSLVAAFRKHEPHTTEGARPTAEQLEAANAELKKLGNVCVSGRLAVPPRVMGKAAFVHLSDGNERLQIYVRRDEVRGIHNDDGAEIEQGWDLFQMLDHGDFIGVEGFLFVTKTGELSVHVRTLQFLAKALVPMPDKLHGVSDPEIRQRQRYVDLIAASLKVDAPKDEQAGDHAATAPPEELNTRQVFERRSKLISAMRRHLDDHGYLEVETPMLSPIASGAAARPFKTHHNALGIDLYARIAPELYLKRLVAGGFERVYELNRNFRNEGVSARHNPEFTMLEFYTAYKDVNWMMDFCEEMLRSCVERITDKQSFLYSRTYLTGPNKEDAATSFDLKTKKVVEDLINFSKIKRLTMKQAISKYISKGLTELEIEELDIAGESFSSTWLDNPKRVRILAKFFRRDYTRRAEINVENTTGLDAWENPYQVEAEEWLLALQDLKIQLSEPTEEQTARDIVFLFETLAEEHLVQPTFITDFPKPVSPLSKASPDNPAIAERFELYIAGMEVANGFSELNDPREQYERFEEQAKQRERGDDEAMQMDTDYVRALSYGMPPAAGIGIGIDRLTMLLTNRRSIRDVILFPHMRPQRHAGPEADDRDPRPE